jgi:hypothetical protein
MSRPQIFVVVGPRILPSIIILKQREFDLAHVVSKVYFLAWLSTCIYSARFVVLYGDLVASKQENSIQLISDNKWFLFCLHYFSSPCSLATLHH